MQGSAGLQGEVGLSDFNFRATTLERKTFFHRVVAYLFQDLVFGMKLKAARELQVYNGHSSSLSNMAIFV